jgi:dihydrofolate reductase
VNPAKVEYIGIITNVVNVDLNLKTKNEPVLKLKKRIDMNQISSVYIATSLDGFIARKDGSIDWLNEANSSIPEGEDCGFFSFMNSVDALVMGRKTFEKVLSFGQWPYADKTIIVLSRNKIDIPDNLSQSVTCSSESPIELTKRLAKNGAKRLYIDGGITIQRFLKEGVIKDLTITIIPIIIGDGIPLFGKVNKDIKLKHIKTRTYDFGFVQSTYEIKM